MTTRASDIDMKITGTGTGAPFVVAGVAVVCLAYAVVTG